MNISYVTANDWILCTIIVYLYQKKHSKMSKKQFRQSKEKKAKPLLTSTKIQESRESEALAGIIVDSIPFPSDKLSDGKVPEVYQIYLLVVDTGDRLGWERCWWGVELWIINVNAHLIVWAQLIHCLSNSMLVCQ